MKSIVGKSILYGVLKHLRNDWMLTDKEERKPIEGSIDDVQMIMHNFFYYS